MKTTWLVEWPAISRTSTAQKATQQRTDGTLKLNNPPCRSAFSKVTVLQLGWTGETP